MWVEKRSTLIFHQIGENLWVSGSQLDNRGSKSSCNGMVTRNPYLKEFGTPFYGGKVIFLTFTLVEKFMIHVYMCVCVCISISNGSWESNYIAVSNSLTHKQGNEFRVSFAYLSVLGGYYYKFF